MYPKETLKHGRGHNNHTPANSAHAIAEKIKQNRIFFQPEALLVYTIYLSRAGGGGISFPATSTPLACVTKVDNEHTGLGCSRSPRYYPDAVAAPAAAAPAAAAPAPAPAGAAAPAAVVAEPPKAPVAAADAPCNVYAETQL